MDSSVELCFKPETLVRYGLPDIPYPVARTDMESGVLVRQESGSRSRLDMLL